MPATPKLGIGALSKATGIHANTIRTWERRYGVPKAVRTAGGHRAYSQDAVEHLSLVKQALGMGHRPATALAMSVDELREMIAATSTSSPNFTPAAATPVIRSWVQATMSLDGDRLEKLFVGGLADMGILPFLENAVAPYLDVVGQAWADGRLTIYQEHFASARLVSFMSNNWQRLTLNTGGEAAVLACPPGEQHVVGLHMAAWVMARRGWRVIFLGANCPVQDMLDAAAVTNAKVIALSISSQADPTTARQAVEELVAQRGDISILLGGAGATAHPRAFRFERLHQLDDWASAGR